MKQIPKHIGAPLDERINWAIEQAQAMGMPELSRFWIDHIVRECADRFGESGADHIRQALEDWKQ